VYRRVLLRAMSAAMLAAPFAAEAQGNKAQPDKLPRVGFLAQGFAPGPTTNPVSRLSIRPVPFVVSALPQALVAGAPVEILAAAAVPAMNVCDCAVPIRIVCDSSPTPWLPMWMLLLPFVTLHRTTGTTPAGPARVLCVILG